ncbi:hypothetical protein EYF80_061246 [Liparis tanakae]|uniref:Uncharacterized protein n=1 Tax=Liparis tanakae TaxID=230148 RepID=A0A4Z2EI27_9TELE|nr:hypothetical protein EYF80_061246 [Liparis tanakae]
MGVGNWGTACGVSRGSSTGERVGTADQIVMKEKPSVAALAVGSRRGAPVGPLSTSLSKMETAVQQAIKTTRSLSSLVRVNRTNSQHMQDRMHNIYGM